MGIGERVAMELINGLRDERALQDRRQHEVFGSGPRRGVPWSADEHQRFCDALERYPQGPWKFVAMHVGTRTTRQVMTHAQKFREKMKRAARARRSSSKVVATAGHLHRVAAASEAEQLVTSLDRQSTELQTILAMDVEKEDDFLGWLDGLQLQIKGDGAPREESAM